MHGKFRPPCPYSKQQQYVEKIPKRFHTFYIYPHIPHTSLQSYITDYLSLTNLFISLAHELLLYYQRKRTT